MNLVNEFDIELLQAKEFVKYWKDTYSSRQEKKSRQDLAMDRDTRQAIKSYYKLVPGQYHSENKLEED